MSEWEFELEDYLDSLNESDFNDDIETEYNPRNEI